MTRNMHVVNSPHPNTNTRRARRQLRLVSLLLKIHLLTIHLPVHAVLVCIPSRITPHRVRVSRAALEIALKRRRDLEDFVDVLERKRFALVDG